jgi:hypothetical protein
MSSPEEDALKRRYKEFLDLMPLTIAIAGLANNTAARSFSNDQMEARAQVLGSAFKIARQAARDALKPS